MIPIEKALQLFSQEALERGGRLSPTQIAEFVEGFRLMYGPREVPPIPEEFRDLVDPDFERVSEEEDRKAG